jgi:hypothetical protein
VLAEKQDMRAKSRCALSVHHILVLSSVAVDVIHDYGKVGIVVAGMLSMQRLRHEIFLGTVLVKIYPSTYRSKHPRDR